MKRLLFTILTTIAYLGVAAQAVPEMMYFKFDGTGTTSVPNAASAPVGNNPAPILGTGTTQGPTGQFGNALNGTNTSSSTDYLNTGWAPNLAGADWTISVWMSSGFNSATPTTLSYVFGDNNTASWRMFTGGVANTGIYLRGGGLTDVIIPGPLFTNDVVLTFVYDSSVPEVRTYVDGVLTVTTAQPGANITGAGPFKVGGYATNGGINGGIDEFRMYNRALTQTEITATWNAPLPIATGPKDMAVLNLISPTQSNSACYGSDQTFSVNVYNFGTDTVFFNTDTVQVTGTTSGPNPQTYTAELNSGFMAPGASMPVVLTTMYDMSAPGTHNFDAYVEFLSGGPDANLSNDTMSTASIVNSSVFLGAGMTFSEDFESFTAGTPGTFDPGWSSSSPNAAAGWFVENDGVQNNTLTGPIDDHTPGGNTYMYTETSSGVAGDQYFLNSPCIDFTGATAPRLSFWYHMYGATMGTLSVHAITSGGFDSTITGFSGQIQTSETDPWLEEIVDLTWLIDSVATIQFIGVRGTSFTGDMAIDDIAVYNAAPIDVSASVIVSPSSGGCFGSNENVVVEIRNDGSLTLDMSVDNVTVDVNVTGANTSSGTVTINSGTLAPLATQNVVVSGIDFSGVGISNVEGIVSTPNDPNQFNDTTAGIVETFPTFGLPFSEDFESFIAGTPGTFDPGWSSTSPNTGAGWFAENDGVANSGSTGPIDDHTAGGSRYMYTETSSGTTGDTYTLVTPCIDLTGQMNPRLSYWYHMYGAAMGSLSVQITTSGGLDSIVSGFTGPQQFAEGDPWLEDIVNLDWLADSIIRITFIGVRGTSFTSDMAIDDILIYNAQPIDALVEQILPLPTATCGFTNNETITAVIKNLGFTTLDTIPMGYSINGGTPVIDTLFTTLVSNDTALFSFAQGANLSQAGATFTIQVWTAVPGDGTLANDTNTYVITNPLGFVAPGASYSEDFETFISGTPGILGNGWTATSPNNFAGWFPEDDGVQNNTNTGPIDDHTTGGSVYMYTETSSGLTGDMYVLTSPCIDLSQADAPRLSFWYHMFGASIGSLEAHVITQNGFDSLVASYAGPQQFAENDPWLESLSNLDFVIDSIIQLQFIGFRGTSFTGDLAIDDILIFNAIPTDAAPIALVDPGETACFSGADTLNVAIFNAGSTPLDFTMDTMDVTVNVTGASTNTYTTQVNTGTLPVGDTLIVTVTPSANFSAGGTHNLEIITSIGADINFFNDTLNATVESLPILASPLIEDLETWVAGAQGTGLGLGWTSTSTSTSTTVGWTVENDGVANSTGTGPIDDHTPGGTTYIYTETSGGAVGDIFDLISPCVDLTTISQPKMSFWYHMFGPLMGTLQVLVKTDTGEVLVWSISGQQQTAESDPWLQGNVNLSGFVAASPVQLIFRSIHGGVFTSDMAIDDINIFEPADFDVQAGAVVSPQTGCGLTAADTVCVEIINFGIDTLDNIIASFSVDGGPFSTPENVPGILLPGDTLIYCFTATADLSTFGTHEITVASTQLVPADTLNANDTSVTEIVHYTAYTGTFPYFQDFDGLGFVPDNVTFSPGAPIINLGDGWLNLQTDGPRDWAVRSAPTGNVGTGPDFDHTTGSTNYLFVEDSWQDDSVIVISPCFDVSSLASPKMSFWYHSNNGNDPNNENLMHIDLIEGSDVIYDIIPPLGHKGNNWSLVEIDMSSYSTNWSVRFRVNSNNGSFLHDIAIDDFGIVDVIPQDAGITDVFTPTSGCGLTSNEDLTLGLANLGTDTILNGVTVNYQISLNGVPGAINSLPSPQDTIFAGVTLPVVISGVNFGTPGTYTVTAWTSGLAGDTNGFNDTTIEIITHIPVVTSYPYSQDFENGDGGWVVDGPSTSWELSTPANVVINSAGSGVNSWITNATGLYNANEDGYVISPCFDFTNLQAPKIEMAVWWESEFSWDGAVLQSTVNNGATWVNVGAFGDPDNWYTDNTINGVPGGSQQGWTGRNGTGATGGSNGWVIAKHALDSLAGEPDVRLRVAFGSDGSVQDDGFAFDDIFIFDTPDDDVGVVAFTSPSASECSSDSTEIIVQVSNFGIQSQTSVPVTVNITGAITQTLTATLTDTLVEGDTLALSLGTINTNVGGTFNFSGYTVLGGDTLFFNDTTIFASDITTSASAPSVFADSTCSQDSAQFMLTASGAASTIIWFDSAGGMPIHVGDTLNTPFLTQTTTYFAQAADFVNINNFSPVDNTFGTGAQYTFFADGLAFDALQDFTLNTVKVYPGGAGTITVNVSDNSGAIIQTASIPFGGTVTDTVITLNFSIPQGTGYEMDLAGSTIPSAFRNTGGAVYPYTAPNVVEITSAINNLAGFYYFFYDWNVTALGCPSPLVPVQAIFLPDVPVDLGPDGTACEGFVVDAFLPQIASYQWSTGVNDTLSTITVNATGSYYVDVVDVNGCIGTDSINLFINPNPVVDLGNDTSACDQLILDAGNPGASYVWSVQGQFGQTLTLTDTGTYDVIVDVTALGCSSSDTITISLANAPVVDLGMDVTGCNPVPLDAGAANAGFNFSWSTGDNTQMIVAMPPMTGSDTVSVTVTDLASGCETTDEVILTAGTPPAVDLGPDGQACDSLNLDAGSGGASYLWSTGATTQMITATTSGQYTVSVTDADGCEGVDTVNLTIDPSPTAGFTLNWINYGYDFEFFDGSANADSILWDFGDGSTSNDPNPLHTYQFNGAFEVTMVVFNDCGTDTFKQVVGPTDIEDDLFGKSISVYPNPSTGLFWVEGFETQAEEITIEVSDARGRLVVKHTKQFVVNGFKQQIDLTGEAEGVYVVKISDGERTAIKRVMRE